MKIKFVLTILKRDPNFLQKFTEVKVKCQMHLNKESVTQLGSDNLKKKKILPLI